MEIKHITTKDVENEIKTGIVLVDFFATWCGPCRMMKPILEEVATENICNIVAVDIDEENALAERFGIYSIPTLIVFENGKELRRVLGLRPKDEIIKLIKG